jgi:hypothetical protein
MLTPAEAGVHENLDSRVRGNDTTVGSRAIPGQMVGHVAGFLG